MSTMTDRERERLDRDTRHNRRLAEEDRRNILAMLAFAWYLSASEADMAWHNAQARGEA